MGLIKAAVQAAKGAAAEQWLEVIEPQDMSSHTVFTQGVRMRRGANVKGDSHVVSNGSVIHVYENQFMILTDGGKIIDYTAEPGYFTVDNSSSPSMFDGQFQEALHEAFARFRFGGVTPVSQHVYYINLQEIKGIKFGTRNAINYFDSFYNAELFLRAHGTYSIRITDPIKFYAEVIPKGASRVEIEEINEQYLSEFLEALQASINQMAADGVRISFVASKSRELGKYMSETLDQDWKEARGIEVQSVGIASISYDETSQKLINMRNQGAMMGDPSIREGYVQSAVAAGVQAAGSNPNGSAAGFMGVNMGMASAGGFMSAASAANMQQMQMNQTAHQSQNTAQQGHKATVNENSSVSWTCNCGTVNQGKFCSECGNPRPQTEWICSCGTVNKGKFCSECGKPRS